MGTGSLSPVSSGRGVALTTHYHLRKRLKKEESYTSTPLWAFMAYSGVNSASVHPEDGGIGVPRNLRYNVPKDTEYRPGIVDS
jgi:hypothetical protein